MYIKSINYFRGISMIFIVFGHCIALADFKYESILGDAIFNLTSGGTSYYVFISGFLFHHVFHRKFEFKRFMIKKTKYVLFPYLILSTIPIVYFLIQFRVDDFTPLSTLSIQLSYYSLLRHYLTGDFFIGYWYIPFIMIIFTMSPIFVQFIKLQLKTQVLITLILLICSIFMQRGIPHHVSSIFQNVLFFIPIYLSGIILSEKKDTVYSELTGKEFYVLIVAIVLAIIQAYSGHLGNYEKKPFSFGGIDLMIIQKILVCLFFMVFLNRFESYKVRSFEIIAENSFGIFFIHGIIIWVMERMKEKLSFSFSSNSFLIYCLLASLVFFLSMLTTLFVKRISPKYSKYLVGS